MANEEHLKQLKQGVEHWNEWRKQQKIRPDLSNTDLYKVDLCTANLRSASLRGADLRGANLTGANLAEANLFGVNLSYAILHKANLRGVYLREANLREANLQSVDLRRTDLKGADLRGANLVLARLSEADLTEANLCEANLRKANLRGTRTSGTIFGQLDLRETKGLAEIRHGGRSHVNLTTVQLPQDGSALHFLRGSGVPDEWIDFWRATMMHPIQYHSLFISYSSKDEILARRLHADLQDHGVRCWFASEDLKIGDEIRSRIDEAIYLQDKLLLLLSEHSIASNWVKNEVEAAFEKEGEQQRLVLFPVRLDESIMQTTKSWAATLRRTRHIGDFTNWKDPQVYLQRFERIATGSQESR